MRLIFILLIFTTIINSGIAQSGNAPIWSDIYEDDGQHSLITSHNNSLYATRIHKYKIFSRDGRMELIKYDNNLKIEYVVEIEDLEDSPYEDIGTIATPEGIMHLYYQSFKNGKMIVSGQIFDYTDLHKLDIVDLVEFKSKNSKNERLSELSLLENIKPLDFKLSPDKSKLVLFFHQEKYNKRKETFYQYKVFNLGDGISVLHEGSFFSDAQSDKYLIKDIDLADNGDLNYLLKSFTKNNTTEFINKKPVYAYEIHHLTGDSTEYIYDIKVNNEFIDDLKITSGNNGEVYAAGLIREKPYGKSNAAYFITLDPTGKKISEDRSQYKPRQIKEIERKKKDELRSEFKIIDVLNGNKMVFVIKQSIERESTTANNNLGGFNTGIGRNNLNRFNISWNLDQVIIEGYSKATHEMSWITTNQRKQHDNDEYIGEFIIGHHQLFNDNLYLIYNERPVNIDRLRKKDKLKTTDVPGDSVEPTIVKINQEGDIKYKTIQGEKNFYIGKSGILIDENGLNLISSKSFYSKYKIGKVDKSILD